MLVIGSEREGVVIDVPLPLLGGTSRFWVSRTFPNLPRPLDVTTIPSLHASLSSKAPLMARSTNQNKKTLGVADVFEAGPPVPPKHYVVRSSQSIQSTQQLRNRRPPPPPPRDHKPLPVLPSSKPLPDLPSPGSDARLNYRTTLLWVLGFCVWFLVIVVMLPVIMERDAMPGFNRWLRQCWASILG
jgi:hypothetical protein